MNILEHGLTLEDAQNKLSSGEVKGVWLFIEGCQYNYGLYSYNTNPERLTASWLENCLNDHPDTRVAIIPDDIAVNYTLFKQTQEAELAPLHEIDREGYWDALEVLPPLKFHNFKGNSVFFMSEFNSGTLTNMYCEMKDGELSRYFCKLVDFTDNQTWITPDLISQFDAEKEKANVE